MIFFPNKVLRRFTYTNKGRGLYGEAQYEYEYAGDILVDFQNTSIQESMKEYGDERHNQFKIYLDINTVLNDTDELRDENNNRYQIIGNIQTYSHIIKYKKAFLALKRDENEFYS